MDGAAASDPDPAPAMTGKSVRFVRETPFGPDVRGVVDVERGPEDAHISCIMPTRGRAFPARLAIACFQNQTYSNRELVVVTAAKNSEVKALVAELDDPRIRFIEAPGAETVGDLRNCAIPQAAGDLIAVWDDDDLSHPYRLQWQYAGLRQGKGDACFLSHVILWWPARAWLTSSSTRRWENTMLVKASVLPPYPGIRRGGDTILVETLKASNHLVTMLMPFGYCYINHGANIWGDAHFERLFRSASHLVRPDEYENQLAFLSKSMPLLDYRDGLADISASIAGSRREQ